MNMRMQRLDRSPGVRRIVLAVLWLGLLLPTAALATPVDIYADPTTGFGWTTTPSGIGSLPAQTGFETSPGSVDITITTPATIPGTNVPAGDFSNPSTGSSIWSITANDRAYTDLWLVIVGHASTDPHGPNGDGFYASGNVGLGIDDADPNLRFVSLSGTSFTYLAVFLGNLAQGQTIDVPIEYRVAQGLFEQAPNDFLFPQYQVAYLEGIAIPEPGSLALGAAALAFGLVRRGRERRRQN